MRCQSCSLFTAGRAELMSDLTCLPWWNVGKVRPGRCSYRLSPIEELPPLVYKIVFADVLMYMYIDKLRSITCIHFISRRTHFPWRLWLVRFEFVPDDSIHKES